MKQIAFFLLLLIFSVNTSTALAQKTTAGVLSNPGTSFTTKAKYTNKQTVWYEYAYWLDGSLLSDPKNRDKFNDVLFKKEGNRYYKAQVDGACNVEDWGLKRKTEGSNAAQNIALLQSMVNYFPASHFPTIYVPSGEWELGGLLELKNPVTFLGQGGTIFSNAGTQIRFTGERQGIVSWGHNSVFQDFALLGSGAAKGLNDGLALRAITTIKRVRVKGFSNNGIGFWANIESERTNASGSYVEDCASAENANDGFFFGRADGNAITVIGCDARDNGRYGFDDDSFLGNNFISCMAHYNKKGDYYVRDKGNARSTFFACYSEGGSPTSQFSQNTRVIGGMWGSGYSLNGKDVLH